MVYRWYIYSSWVSKGEQTTHVAEKAACGAGPRAKVDPPSWIGHVDHVELSEFLCDMLQYK